MSKPDVAILIVVLTGAACLIVALLGVTNQINEEVEKPGAFDVINPRPVFRDMSSGTIAVLFIVGVALVFLTHGILWG